MTDQHTTTLKMLILSGGGLVLSFTEIESILRILSLLVTMTLSVLVYLRKTRSDKRNNDEKNMD